MNPLNIPRMEQEARPRSQPKVKLTDNVLYSIQTTSNEERERILEQCYVEDWSQGMPFMADWELEPFINIDSKLKVFDTSIYPWEQLVILSTDIE